MPSFRPLNTAARLTPALATAAVLAAATLTATAGAAVATTDGAGTAITLSVSEDGPRSAEVLKKYELDRTGLAVNGYDPVAYFPEGDPAGKGAAVKGSKKITYTHRGVTYRFSSEANRELFKANPNRYEPAYGGWCAYAAANEGYTEPDPKNFIVDDGRLFLFYKGVFTNTKTAWLKEGPAQLERQADAFWLAETGEQPRDIDVSGKPNAGR